MNFFVLYLIFVWSFFFLFVNFFCTYILYFAFSLFFYKFCLLVNISYRYLECDINTNNDTNTHENLIRQSKLKNKIDN